MSNKDSEMRDVVVKVKDGFGGQKVKRSYRINLFSTMVPKLGSGKWVVNILLGYIMCLSSRKRKFGVDQETSAADYRT